MTTIPQPGMVFASYKQLASYIGEPIKKGASIELQMRKWLNHFTWERIPGTYKIIINHFQQPNVNLTSSPQWTNHVAPQITYELIQVLKGNGLNANSRYFKELILSGTEAYIQFGLVNPQWTTLKDARLPDIDEELQLEFMHFSNEKLYHVIYDALVSLKRKGICNGTRAYLVYDQDNLRVASSEEQELLQLLTIAILADMRVYNERKLFKLRRSKEFYEKLGLEFGTRTSMILGHKVWRITFLPDRLEGILEKVAKHPVIVHRQMANAESYRWHVEKLGTIHGDTIDMVIPTKQLLTFINGRNEDPKREEDLQSSSNGPQGEALYD